MQHINIEEIVINNESVVTEESFELFESFQKDLLKSVESGVSLIDKEEYKPYFDIDTFIAHLDHKYRSKRKPKEAF